MSNEKKLKKMNALLDEVRHGAIYARYSSNNQRDESIEAQIRAIEEYAKRNNIQIVKVYVDKALTGTNDRRPEFQQMIEDSSKGLFDTLLIHKLDRFSRDKYDSAHYKRILKKNRVRLISVLENLDDSPESLILESVLEGLAAYYSKNLSREVMKGLRETAYQCRHTGGRPPIGYSVDPDSRKYIINEYEKGIVETVFSMYLNGYGYNQILSRLSEQGYKGRTGRPIGKNTLLEILKNEKYTGVYIFNQTDGKDAFGQRNSNRKKADEDIIRIEGGMPILISKEEFNIVQEKIFQNKRAPGAYKAKEMYLLSGLTVCGECLNRLDKEFSMMGNVKYSGRNKLKYVTYRCGNRDRTKECKNKELRREYIENYVIHELERRIFNDNAIPHLVKHLNEYQKSVYNSKKSDLQGFRKKLTEIDRQITNIIEAVSGGFTQSSFGVKLDKLENEKAQLEVQIAERQFSKEHPLITEVELRQLFVEFKEYISTRNVPEIKKFIGSYVDKVIIYNEHVEVIFKLDAVGITLDGNDFDAFAATVAKKELFEVVTDVV
ncbi:recombinase family protein [Paenibacillus sp. FSL R10-2736]|uniref:recombinase family protein n=1 Tax=Paenibacillus sp. FSL R10-2736 TaxID=2954692 RepID=UPI0030F5FB65